MVIIMDKFIWTGPRESDISGLDNVFCTSTTIFGSNKKNNHSYSKSRHKRVNHNDPNCIPDDFITANIVESIKQNPNLKIMYYNPIFSKFLPKEYRERVVGCNDLSILEFLDSKCDVRQMASRIVPVVPFQTINNVNELKKAMPNLQEGFEYILQENHSSGGYGTHIVNKDNIKRIISSFDPTKRAFVSPYFKKSYSVNTHCILFKDYTVVLPGSIQIVGNINNKINYIGSDFAAYELLPQETRSLIKQYSKQIGNYLRKIGYKGVLGIDFLIIKGKPHLLEINGRFQASTPVINKALIDNNLPSVQELNILSFKNESYLQYNKIESLNVPYSMAVYNTETWKKDIEVLQKLKVNEIQSIEFNGYDVNEDIDNGAYLFHIIFCTNICSVSPDGYLWNYENLFDIDTDFVSGIFDKKPLNVKISLLNQGVRITKEVREFLNSYGEIRKAVFSAVDITIFDNLHVNCPSDVKFIEFTPWVICLSKDKRLQLFFRNNFISDVSLDMKDIHSKYCTVSGLPYEKVSFWATDRMRIHHTISCIFKKTDKGCKFCEVPKQCENLKISDIFEIIDYYLTNANSFRHFLIGGGSESIDQEESHIIEIAEYIREKSDKPIYLMCLPPKKLSTLQSWYQAGVTEVAFNLELFDRELAKKYMPGKGKIPLSQYLTALKMATSIWGKSGNVRTLFVVGLEKRETLIEGIKVICSYGVMPILSVFRALKGTEMQNVVPPSNDWLLDIYKESETICKKYSLHLGPSCPACQNNTLSLPFNMLK